MPPTLKFDNRFTTSLPADPTGANDTRQVHGAAFSRVDPTPVSNPTLVAVSDEMMALLGLNSPDVTPLWMAEVFSGNRTLAGMDPFAMNYGGHQFGNWAGQLGDGRAIALGEAVACDGSHQMIQLKGAGPTPYSRRADGRAVLRSSVREFLCSEAMHHLGVPTTRALCLLMTGDDVVRDMFYDGRPAAEPGAIVTRVAPSFTRFGNIQLPASRGDTDLTRQIADHTIATDFSGPDSADTDFGGPEFSGPGDPNRYVQLLAEVSKRTAHLMVHWMRVGFVHGVMNTDNMSITGLTIDYGPYGWLEGYDLSWTPNTTDASHRRYRYGSQPQVAQWNLVQLASALHTLVPDVDALQAALNTYVETFEKQWAQTFADKLGIGLYRDADGELFAETHRVLQRVETDMTIFFRRLAMVDTSRPIVEIPEPLIDAYYDPADPVIDPVNPADRESARDEIVAWCERWRQRVLASDQSEADRTATMNATNPKFVLRNYMAQLATDAAEQGDPSVITELLDVLRHPYDEQPDREQWAAKRPEWARDRPGCSMLSCSS